MNNLYRTVVYLDKVSPPEMLSIVPQIGINKIMEMVKKNNLNLNRERLESLEVKEEIAIQITVGTWLSIKRLK